MNDSNTAHADALIAAQVIREHEPRPGGCACGVQIGDDIDRRWHLVNPSNRSLSEVRS